MEKWMIRRGIGLEPLPRRNAENSAAGMSAIGLTRSSLKHKGKTSIIDLLTASEETAGYLFWIGHEINRQEINWIGVFYGSIWKEKMLWR